MSQGLFRVERTAAGDRQASRVAAGEQMVDAAGHAVREETLSMPLTDLRAKVAKALAVAVSAAASGVQGQRASK